MNFREKEAFIAIAADQLKHGGQWADFQGQLAALAGVSSREREVIAVKVIRSLERSFGPALLTAVEYDPRAAVNPGLDPVVFQKIHDRQVKAFCNRVVNAMARQLDRGDDPDQVFAAHRHPLITRDDLRRAKRKYAKPAADFSILEEEVAMLPKVLLLVVKLAYAYFTYFSSN